MKRFKSKKRKKGNKRKREKEMSGNENADEMKTGNRDEGKKRKTRGP